MEQVLAQAIATAEPSVVSIARVRRQTARDANPPVFPRDLRNESPEPLEPDFVPNEFATGVVVDAKGLVLTCQHVLRENSDYFVYTHERKAYRAKVKAADPRSDLAVLELTGNVSLTPIRFGDVSKLAKGQIVLALGNPYAIARDGTASASWGIISNLSRQAGPHGANRSQQSRPTLHHFGTLIHTDARLNLGTSGGALLNLKGEMIGLTTSQAALAGFEQSAGYAMPVDETFQRALETLKQGREVEYGLLGVLPADLSEFQRANGKWGARVDAVLRGTPAYGNLEMGDIITHVDSVAVDNCSEMMLAVGRKPAGANVTLKVERQRDGGGSRTLEVSVQLTKFPVQGKKIHEIPTPSWRGMVVEYPTAVQGVVLQGTGGSEYPEDACVAVAEVADASPAWKAGFRPGMLVTHVAGVPIATPDQFHAALAGRPGPVRLRVIAASDNKLDRVVEAE